LELEARLGYGLPVGDVDTRAAGAVRDPLGQTIEGMVPIWIDGGYRFSPQWFAGLYLMYAPGFLGGALQRQCENGRSCSVFDVRAGAELQYHLAPQGPWDPWLGAGLGYEWLRVGASATGVSSTEQWASGFELANLQAGLDVPVGARVSVGPFAALTTAVYSWNDSLPSSNTFGGPALHAWVVLGVRGTVDLSSPPKDDGPKLNWSE
jgi:hypothetical protein